MHTSIDNFQAFCVIQMVSETTTVTEPSKGELKMIGLKVLIQKWKIAPSQTKLFILLDLALGE